MRDFIVTIDCREAPPENVRHEIQGNKINIIVTPSKGGLSREHVSFSEGPLPYDCIVTVDAGDTSQFGKIFETFPELFHLAPVINIDHHASNTGFGKINHVDVMAPSTTTLILPLIEELGANLIDADVATLLLAGLITDTGSFQNANTTPDAFAIAAKLIGYGARQQEIIRHVYKTKKLSQLRLWGRTLTKIQYDEKHKLVWSILTARDFAEIGSSPDETEGVIDELMSNAPGAEIIFLLKERSATEVSGSVRTLTTAIDASKLAEIFGGGGHVQAAGFKLHGENIQEAETAVVDAFRGHQAKRLGLIAQAAPILIATPLQQTAVSQIASSPPQTTAQQIAPPQSIPTAPIATTQPTHSNMPLPPLFVPQAPSAAQPTLPPIPASAQPIQPFAPQTSSTQSQLQQPLQPFNRPFPTPPGVV